MDLLQDSGKDKRNRLMTRILMIGPGRDVKGGISSVVNNYYSCGLDQRVTLRYLPTMEDGNKIKKIFVAVKAYLVFCNCIKSYDVLHVHMAAQASFDRKAFFIRKAKKLSKKIIIHQHAADFDAYFLEQADDKKRERIRTVFSMADNVIVLSKEWEEFFGEHVCDKNKIIVIHNGIMISEVKKKDYLKKNILMLGRLGERKGTYDLLEAIPHVLKQIPNCMFYLGGDGDIQKCRELIKQKNLQDHVSLLGWIDDAKKKEYFENCSIFVLPSHHEGMPMALLEAMGHGLASISTNVGGISSVIENETCGILIQAGDVSQLTRALIRLLEDSELRQKIGEAGQKHIMENFNVESGIQKLISLYES